MTVPRFIQIHSLVSYPSVLLNRDDSGLSKRISYGGAVRTRVSSQCLKRRWRVAEDDWSLANTGAELSVRSREVFEYEIAPRMQEEFPSADPKAIEAVGDAISKALYGDKAGTLRSRQALLLGWPEIRFLTEEAFGLMRTSNDTAVIAKAAEAHFKGKDAKANFTAMKDKAGSLAAGLEAALFGRMVTSDTKANTDAAIHVAHAFTVHAQESETDYFTVVDDLNGDSGSAGIFDTELTSGLFYEYVVIDVPLLVSNLAGVAQDGWAGPDVDRTLAGKVVEHVLHLIATVSPGAKKGSTAPYAFASTLLVEAGPRQPRSLASAFETPIKAGVEGLGVKTETALFNRLADFDRCYGIKEARRFLSLVQEPRPGLTGPANLDALAAWARDVIVAGEA